MRRRSSVVVVVVVVVGGGGDAPRRQCRNITAGAFSPSALGLLVGNDDTPVELVAANDACSYADRSQLTVVPVPQVTGVEPPGV